MKKFLSCIMAALTIFALCVPICANSFSELKVEDLDSTSIEYDFQYVISDRSLKKYPANADNNTFELISFIEKGYESSNPGDFGVYLYIYNPSQRTVVKNEAHNLVQLTASIFGGPESSPYYAKYHIDYVNSYGATEDTSITTNGLILKFKLSGYQKVIDRVSYIGQERYYHISGIELYSSPISASVQSSSAQNDAYFNNSASYQPAKVRINGNTVNGVNAGDNGMTYYIRGTNLDTPVNIYAAANKFKIVEYDGHNAVSFIDSHAYKYLPYWLKSDKRYTVSVEFYVDNISDSSVNFYFSLIFAFFYNEKDYIPAIVSSPSDYWNERSLTSSDKNIFYLGLASYNSVNCVYVDIDSFILCEGTSITTNQKYYDPSVIEIPSEVVDVMGNTISLKMGSGDYLEIDYLSDTVNYFTGGSMYDISNAAFARELFEYRIPVNHDAVVGTAEDAVDISSIEVSWINEQTFTLDEWKVDHAYYFQEFNGYVSSRVEYPDKTLTVDAYHTFYRVQSELENKYKDIQTVYFNVPNDIIREYGELDALKAVWEECKLAPILITSYESVYDTYKNFENVTLNDTIDFSPFMYGKYKKSFFNYHFRGGVGLNAQNIDNKYDKIPAIFYFPDGWESEQMLVSSEELAAKLGAQSSLWSDDLFVEIDKSHFDLNEPELLSISNTHSLSKYKSSIPTLLKSLFSTNDVKMLYDENVDFSEIMKVDYSDISLSDEKFAEKYFVTPSDVSAIKSRASADSTMYLLRFTVTDYSIYSLWTTGYEHTGAFVCETTAIRNFDIIECHFKINDHVTIFPVVHSPSNFVADITAPAMPNNPNPFAELLEFIKNVCVIIICCVVLALVMKVITFINSFKKSKGRK